MARDITASLRALDPADPVKYDFSLCHLGMMNACGFSRAQADCAVSAAWGLPATRAYTAAVSATIRSTVKRSLHAREAGLAHPLRAVASSRSSRTIACGQRAVIARRHQQAGHAVLDDFGNAAGPRRDDRPARRPSRRAATCRALR